MRHIYLFFLLIITAICSISCSDDFIDSPESFEEKLRSLPNVVSVTAQDPGAFKERYKVFFRQPVDHDNPSAGTYDQLVYVMLNNTDSLNVLVTEGYYAFDAEKEQELVPMFGANQIVVEHRYFGESTVDDPEYRYMNADNCCDDLHEVVTSLKMLLGGKWISTGVSKSGLASNAYQAWYPNDVDVTVTYGTPLCRERYDSRAAKALAETIGTAGQRAKLTAFMREALRRRDAMAPKFDSVAEASGIKLPLPARQLWDFHVLDWQVAAWMFSYDFEAMPSLAASDDEIFNYIIDLDGPEAWDAAYDVNKYYIQAYAELGHFSFCTEGVKDLMVVDDNIVNDYLRYLYVPAGFPDTFSTAVHDKVDAFLRSTDAQCIFIYGGNDPWSFVGVGEEYANGDNLCRYVLPGAGHHVKIADFDSGTRSEIVGKVRSFLSSPE